MLRQWVVSAVIHMKTASFLITDLSVKRLDGTARMLRVIKTLP